MALRYKAFGLVIESDLPLPELEPCPSVDISVEIRLEKSGELPRPSRPEECRKVTASRAHFSWDNVGEFVTQSGSEIIVAPSPVAGEDILRLPLLGVVFSSILYQRGFAVLHGSSVAIDNKAVAFLGDKGWGKSTIAAWLYKRGHTHIADDTVALDVSDGVVPKVASSFPQIKLWPDTVDALGDDLDEVPLVAPKMQKRSKVLVRRFARHPTPLTNIYILDNGPVLTIEPIRPQQGMMELIRNSFAARFGNGIDPSEMSSNFRRFSRIASRTPMFYLRRPRSLDKLTQLVDLVENHTLSVA